MLTSILKRSVALTFFAVALVASAKPSTNQAAALRVVSYNIRFTNPNDGTNGWEFRKDYFFQTIEELAPTLIGFQEVRPDQYEEIVPHLKKYELVGVGRDDGKNEGERSLIAYEKDRFKKIKEGTFWLSETPEVAGSKSWDAAITRVCSWVLLEDRKAGREFLFANTHFDHKGVKARENSARFLSDKLKELAQGKPIILTGDFNFNEDSPAYAALMRGKGSEPWLVDSYRKLHPERVKHEGSFHGFKGTTEGSRIDFIFHTPEIKTVSAAIERLHSAEGRFPSDHYPVSAVLE